MIIDKPKQKLKHKNMQLSEADIDQLAVFDELIADSLIKISKIKTVQRYSRDENGIAVSTLNGKGEVEFILVDYTHEKLKVKKMAANYNKYRKAKKAFVKTLENKNVNK